MESYISTIMLWAATFAPRGWAYCQGQIISIAQNTALFALLGTTYGGNGQTTFALPDFRSRVPVGPGQGPGLSNYVLGQVGGTETVTLIGTQIPAHTHSVALTATISASNAAATTGVPAAGTNTLAAPIDPGTGNPLFAYNNAAPNVVLNTGTSNVSGESGIYGGGQPHSNMQPYLCMNFIICMEGIFPSRD
ncbi:phage tail protein [uncultured Chitinophaga sp.]|uniref:phage tail protein n=1 Tax=uncultured Chitinophaga sp. TaxID=339340 RepID=UPI0025D01489|nr:tail fiber protein [uncultured Chitinophaga sp.]